MDGLWATKSEGVGLIDRAISFQDFQPMWSWSTNVTDGRTDGRTDGQHAISIPRYALVHRAVKTKVTFSFSMCNSIYAECAICYRPSICLSVTRVDQSKMVEVSIMQLSPHFCLEALLRQAKPCKRRAQTCGSQVCVSQLVLLLQQTVWVPSRQ